MRSDLEQLEQIDQYLSGKMTAEQSAAFEAKINADPSLKSMVQDQQLLIQTVNRKALMAEINAVAGAAGAAGTAGAGWGITQWIITALTVASVAVGGVLIYNTTRSEDSKIVEETVQENVVPAGPNEETVNMDSSELFSFSMDAEDEESSLELESELSAPPRIDPLDTPPNENSGLLDELNTFDGPTFTDGSSDNLDEKPNSKPALESTSNTKKTNLKASFPGGRPALKKFFKKNLLYPRTPYDKGLSGTVKVTFVVTADGLIENLESDCYIMFDKNGKPLSSGKMLANKKSKGYFEEKAERVFRISSPWDPATDSNGNPVLSLQTWFVKYNLNGESEVYPSLDDEQSSINACGISSEKDWKKVELRVMNVKSVPKKFKVKGENLISTSRKINDPDDLTTEEYYEITTKAAKYGSCIVYLDVNEFWGSQEKGLYYMYGVMND